SGRAIAAAVQSPPRRRDTQRLATVPGEDSRNIPTLNDSVNPRWRGRQQRLVGTERQFPCAMRFEAMRAVKDQQALLAVSISWVAFARSGVAGIGIAGRGVAYGSRPGVVKLAAEAAGQPLS